MPANLMFEKTAAGGEETPPGEATRGRRAFSPLRAWWFVVVVATLVLAVIVIALEVDSLVPIGYQGRLTITQNYLAGRVLRARPSSS